MQKLSSNFGYLPQSCNFTSGKIKVADLPDLYTLIDKVSDHHGSIHKDWFYAPHTLPYKSRVFGLPKTHKLTHEKADSIEHLQFLVWCLGFFAGIRLTTTEAGFLDATPIKTEMLTDFVLMNCTFADAVALADAFWRQNANYDRRAKLVCSIIHSLFIAQYPPAMCFERFMYLYAALDACFALAESINPPSRKLSHAARLEWLCDQFKIPTPAWAVPGQGKSEVSLVRNPLLHEALFFEEPLGFSIYGGNESITNRGNIMLEMKALVCRLLVSLLGKADMGYATSAVNSRQMHGLNLS